jgi:hypothetical protein
LTNQPDSRTQAALDDQTSAPPPLAAPPTPPDFKQVRGYLRTIQQREALGQFIKAGWTPAELAEFARDTFLAHGKTYPTAASYRYAIEKGADHPYAVETLASLRAPGFVMPPFDRPVPKRYSWDDPDNPEHTPEIRADVACIAQLMRVRDAARLNLPPPDTNEPISRALWRRCYRIRNRYHSLEDTLEIHGLREDQPSAPSPLEVNSHDAAVVS